MATDYNWGFDKKVDDVRDEVLSLLSAPLPTPLTTLDDLRHPDIVKMARVAKTAQALLFAINRL